MALYFLLDDVDTTAYSTYIGGFVFGVIFAVIMKVTRADQYLSENID